MNRVAIAFSTKDRVELSKQSFAGLTGRLPGNSHTPVLPFDIFLVDGSDSREGGGFLLAMCNQMAEPQQCYIYGNVRGGADAAIVYSLTTMLAHPNNYTHVGLVENDVLLHKDWFGPTMALFERGAADGLEVGAVSARCFEDRILFQRDGYAVCHNLGAGMVIFSRNAAQLVLNNFRTGWWGENRRTFMQLSGLDIGRYAAFRANEQWTVADWHFDTVLAELGYASLALTPSPVEMIGQIPSLEDQGLKLATVPVELLRNDKAFDIFRENLALRRGEVQIPNSSQFHHADDGTWMIFAHQVPALGGKYEGDWNLKWSPGFGPFAWKAGWDGQSNIGQKFSENIPRLTVPISGPCSFLVSGGEKGGAIEVEDLDSGYRVAPELPPEGPQTSVLNLAVPGYIAYRNIKLTALSPGIVFYGIQTREPQPFLAKVPFNHSVLPPP